MIIIDAEWEELDEVPQVKIEHKKHYYGWLWEFPTVVSLSLITGRLLGLWIYGG